MTEQSLPQRSQEPDVPVRVRHADVVRQVQRRVGRTPLGAQTIGAWVKPDGTNEDLRSGLDTPWYVDTERQLRRLGGPASRALTRLAGHIEVQVVVARIGRGEMTEATLTVVDPEGRVWTYPKGARTR